MEFKIGDVVVLKSGGPRMTIQDIGDYEYKGIMNEKGLLCVWFEATTKIDGAFHPDSVDLHK